MWWCGGGSEALPAEPRRRRSARHPDSQYCGGDGGGARWAAADSGCGDCRLLPRMWCCGGGGGGGGGGGRCGGECGGWGAVAVAVAGCAAMAAGRPRDGAALQRMASREPAAPRWFNPAALFQTNTFNGTLLYLTGRLGGTAVQRAASREPAASSQHRRWRLNDRSVYDGGGERRLGDREPAASTCDARPSRALTRVTLRLPMGGAQPAARRRATFPCERVEAGRLGGAERAAERRRRRRGGPSSFLAVMEFSSLSLKQNTQNT